MGCSASTIASKDKNFKYAIALDGSEQANIGFEKILNEKFKIGNKLYLIHIYNPAKFIEMPLEKLPEHILIKHEKALNENLQKSEFEIIKKEKINIEESSLKLVNQIALEKKTDLLVVGCAGHKGVKKTKKLSKGLIYLIQNCKIPTLVMKIIDQRTKPNLGCNWLLCIKDDNDRSFRSFEFAMKLIDKEKDKVIGMHFISEKFLAENVCKIFEKKCKENKIKNRLFVKRENDKSQTLGKNILDYLIVCQDNIEYIVVNHNMQKYMDLERCPTVELVKYASNNIIFCRE